MENCHIKTKYNWDLVQEYSLNHSIKECGLKFGFHPDYWGWAIRKGLVKPITKNPTHYQPGDLVCWNLSGNISHIGLVINRKSADGQRYLIVHNIGGGQVIEDCLFSWKIIGHYQYKV